MQGAPENELSCVISYSEALINAKRIARVNHINDLKDRYLLERTDDK